MNLILEDKTLQLFLLVLVYSLCFKFKSQCGSNFEFKQPNNINRAAGLKIYIILIGSTHFLLEKTSAVLDRFQDSSKTGSGINFFAAFLAAFFAAFFASKNDTLF